MRMHPFRFSWPRKPLRRLPGRALLRVEQLEARLTPSGNPVSDGGFETPALAAGSFQYNPTGSPWTFTKTAGISGNFSAFTSGDPGAPEGTQVAFLQAHGSISQTIVLPTGFFELGFSACQRTNVQTTWQTFQVLIDGTVVSSFDNLTVLTYVPATAFFNVSAGSHTLTFQGTDLSGGDCTVFLDQIGIVQRQETDAGFETPKVLLRSFQYNPTGSPWTFTSTAGISSNGSAFTSGNPGAPEGDQVAFLQAHGGVSQSAALPAGIYEVIFSAAQRANIQASAQTFQVLIDGTVVSSFNNFTGTIYATLSTASFTVGAGSHTLTFQGTDLAGGDNTVFIDQIQIVQTQTNLQDPSFETPAVGNGNFQYNPASSPWTFQRSTGVAANGSAFTGGNPPAPQGNQVAFIQALGSISQSFMSSGGTFTITFSAAQRANVQASTQTFQVLIDGTVVGGFIILTGTGYTTLETGAMALSAGSHTLVFQGTDLHGGDNTVFIDQVTILRQYL